MDVQASVAEGLERLIVRKDHVLCTRCARIEPVHPGNGTPAITFMIALESLAKAHVNCRNRSSDHNKPKGE